MTSSPYDVIIGLSGSTLQVFNKTYVYMLGVELASTNNCALSNGQGFSISSSWPADDCYDLQVSMLPEHMFLNISQTNIVGGGTVEIPYTLQYGNGT